jgi:hypothetical protein
MAIRLLRGRKECNLSIRINSKQTGGFDLKHFLPVIFSFFMFACADDKATTLIDNPDLDQKELTLFKIKLEGLWEIQTCPNAAKTSWEFNASGQVNLMIKQYFPPGCGGSVKETRQKYGAYVIEALPSVNSARIKFKFDGFHTEGDISEFEAAVVIDNLIAKIYIFSGTIWKAGQPTEMNRDDLNMMGEITLVRNRLP